MFQRTYTKSALPEKLKDEINEQIPGIVENIDTDPGDVVKVVLTREPTAPEDATLTQLVNDHVPSYLNYRIWDYVVHPEAKHTDPTDINWGILPFAAKTTHVDGEVTERIYYASATINPDGTFNYTTPVLRTDWTYVSN